MVSNLSLSDFPEGITWVQKQVAVRLIAQFNLSSNDFPSDVAHIIAIYVKDGLPQPSKSAVGRITGHKYYRFMFGCKGVLKPHHLSWEKWWVLAAIYGYQCQPTLLKAKEELEKRLGKKIDGFSYPGPIPAYNYGYEDPSPNGENGSGEDEAGDLGKNPELDQTTEVAHQAVEKRGRAISCLFVSDIEEEEPGPKKQRQMADERSSATPSLFISATTRDDLVRRLVALEEEHKKTQKDNEALNSMVSTLANEAQEHREALNSRISRLANKTCECQGAVDLRISGLATKVATMLEAQEELEARVDELTARETGDTELVSLRAVADKLRDDVSELDKITKSLGEVQRASMHQL
ncbi:hypothetical protein B0T10DRAFT_573498 [Thelonectria olida]|uniref:Uncharacterized protein n=1 Tax=Thelonectria olida TaxID=1576542 RepID=A0A9P8W5Y5_9HYPO|nr:hypothetical protein B0T10DRAFT_573498 [Thelonectria olida]